jgi:hypothetical protein
VSVPVHEWRNSGRRAFEARESRFDRRQGKVVRHV